MYDIIVNYTYTLNVCMYMENEVNFMPDQDLRASGLPYYIINIYSQIRITCACTYTYMHNILYMF